MRPSRTPSDKTSRGMSQSTGDHITIVDGHTLNPGDLSWEPFYALGTVEVYDNTKIDQLLSRAKHSTAVITNKVPLRRDLIDQLQYLRYIGVTATGYDVVDIDAAQDRGIAVTNVPDYSTSSVAQMTFALLLELCHRVGHHNDAVKAGRWSNAQNFCFWDYPLIELNGLTMGIVGLGRIGSAVAALAMAFGMRVLGVKRNQAIRARSGIELADLSTLFREADVVSLHCPLTPETTRMVDMERLQSMKRTSILINTARGGLISYEDLDVALRTGLIAGAALDVLEAEPPPWGHRLFSAPNCIITPHIAWATKAARSRLLDLAAANLRAYQNGTPTNVVNQSTDAI